MFKISEKEKQDSKMTQNQDEGDPRFEPVEMKKEETPWRKDNKFNKYDVTFPQIVYEGLSSGKTMAQVARLLDCSKQTLERWIEEIDDMREAFELGFTNFEANMEDFIQENMIFDDPDEEPPIINNKMFEMYTKANVEKYQKQDKNTNVLKEDAEGDAARIAQIMNSVARIAEVSSGSNSSDKIIDITPEKESV